MNVLQEADRLIHGDRNADYGHPLDDFQCSADILRALVRRRYGIDIPFEADFVVLFMACGVKGSREAGKHKDDNCVDGPGYWGLIPMILDERHRRETAMETFGPLPTGRGKP